MNLNFEQASYWSPKKSNRGVNKELKILQKQIVTLESENRDLKNRLDFIEVNENTKY